RGDGGGADVQWTERLRRQPAEGGRGARAGGDVRGEPRHRPPVLREAQATREVRGGEVPERGPIEAALEPGRDPVVRGRAGLELARIAQDRVVLFCPRIRAADEDVLYVGQTAGVPAQRVRR